MNAITHLYSVDSLVLNERKIHFDDALACQFFVLDHKRCQFVVTNPANVLEGPMSLRQVLGKPSALLKRIEYTLFGMSDGSRLHLQRYVHDFTSHTSVDDSFECVARDKALFIPYPLDVLLDTKDRFPKVTAVQFIS